MASRVRDPGRWDCIFTTAPHRMADPAWPAPPPALLSGCPVCSPTRCSCAGDGAMVEHVARRRTRIRPRPSPTGTAGVGGHVGTSQTTTCTAASHALWQQPGHRDSPLSGDPGSSPAREALRGCARPQLRLDLAAAWLTPPPVCLAASPGPDPARRRAVPRTFASAVRRVTTWAARQAPLILCLHTPVSHSPGLVAPRRRRLQGTLACSLRRPQPSPLLLHPPYRQLRPRPGRPTCTAASASCAICTCTRLRLARSHVRLPKHDHAPQPTPRQRRPPLPRRRRPCPSLARRHCRDASQPTHRCSCNPNPHRATLHLHLHRHRRPLPRT